ncbi:MAG: hypothetical protein QF659_04895 [Dehalococcoidia bacterium]|jgi:hypothetical protein|nr:hypothetical protein [Dehalococcoidia bacterium]
MNLFRSEEHARSWSGFDPAFEETLQPLAYWVERFSAERHRARGAADYMSRRAAGEL